VPANAGAPGWPDAALLAGEPAVVELAGRPAVPSGAWEEPPRQAFAIPLAERGGSEPAGLVLAGLNPYRALDEEYRGFLELVAGQIASSLSNVRARQAERERAEALA
jgi:GAF domain-containing protein